MRFYFVTILLLIKFVCTFIFFCFSKLVYKDNIKNKNEEWVSVCGTNPIGGVDVFIKFWFWR